MSSTIPLERKITDKDQLRRIDIRAPQSGVVHEMAAHTVGGVISAGEPIMMIVPEADALEVETRVIPQTSTRCISARRQYCPSRPSTSAPRSRSTARQATSRPTSTPTPTATFYKARFAIPADGLSRLADVHLVSSIPVESFVQTTERTVTSHLTKPLTDQVNRAFKESR
jgi:HlyD family secretion protein